MLAGAFMGIGGILPGISGGIMCVSMGLYEPIINALDTLFKDFKKNILFLIPIGLGALIAGFLTSKLLGVLLDKYEMALMYTLVGLIISGVPSLVREAYQDENKKIKFKWSYAIAIIAGLMMIFLLGYIEHAFESGGKIAFSSWTALLAGAIIAIGCLIPGLSTAAILMSLGIYAPLVEAVNGFDIKILLFVLLGIVVITILLIKGIKKLFQKFHSYAYSFVIGLLFSSIIGAIMKLKFVFEPVQIIYIILLIGGIALGIYMDKQMELMK